MTITFRRPRVVAIILAFVALALAAVLSGCGMEATNKSLSDLNAELGGTSGTVRTFDQAGNMVDEIKGKSFAFGRDERFDSKDSEGNSNKDSAVITISLADQMMYMVGSTMVFAEDGVVDVSSELPTTARFSNGDSGTPWLNKIRKGYTDLWRGKAYTIMIRSQYGSPIAVYSGNSVTHYSTDLEKSTIFMVDGKRLVVYRANFTVVPNALLDKQR